MSKELSPLEHLEFIRNYEIDDEHRTLNMNYATRQSLDIIETALKVLEQLQIIIGAEKIEDLPKVALETENACYSNSHILKKAENKLKALEIIKNKKVNIAALLELDSLQQYNDYCDMVGGCKKLTQEEYSLLKEMLL